MSTNEGGLAFPMPPHEHNRNWSDGMTLRDYFAAKALQGLLASEAYAEAKNHLVAAYAYEQADAMLLKRSGGIKQTQTSEMRGLLMSWRAAMQRPRPTDYEALVETLLRDTHEVLEATAPETRP